jgi:hypothetical protein
VSRAADAGRAGGIARRWRLPVVLGLAVLAAGAVIALLQPSPSNYLDPNDTGPSGGHALADLLAARGQRVIRTQAPETGSAATTSTGDLELITSPDDLTSAQLAAAGRFAGDILLVGPTPAALGTIAPAVAATGEDPSVSVLAPLCNDESANLAGNAYAGGVVLSSGDPADETCYPADGGYFMVGYSGGGRRTIDVLGSGAPLTNQYLGDDGDAALALNLLRQARTIIWVVPSPAAAGQTSATGQRSFTSLVPWPVYLIVIQLAVAVVLAAAWRARRLGPLVAERLPVVVRASETVEGHGRLYQARRARDRAASELRQAARARISRLSGGSGETNAAAVAARTGDAPQDVTALLYGPAPRTDAQLVTLADDLDILERKVRQS